MEFNNGLGDKAIQDVMQNYPEIGEILASLRHRLHHLQGGHLPAEGRGLHSRLVQGRRSENRTGNQRHI